MTVRFDGRVAVVTGAGRGLGRAHAMLLASRGASVVVNDLGTTVEGVGADRQTAVDVIEEIAKHGGVAVSNFDSVSEAEGAESIVGTALDRFGRLDIVVNNAGILTTTEFPETPDEDFDKHFRVHLQGAFNVSRAAWPHMVEQRFGRIVCTTSASFLGMRPIISYATAKAGLIGFTKSLSVIGREHNILANLVAPLANTRMSGRSRTATTETARRRGPSNQSRQPEMVAPVVAYLAHDSCEASGEILGVGMGRVARIFVAETTGFTNIDLSPEHVRDNWSQIIDTADYFVPSDYQEYSARFREIVESQIQGREDS